MTIRIQGCVRTASSNKNGEDNIVYGRLTLSAGAWDFGYNVTYGEVSVTWVPSTARISLSPDTTSIVFRLWNTSSEVLRQNPDTKALGVQPVLQEEVNLEKFGDDGYKHKLSLELNEFLVFGFEGTGPALGEQEKKSDDGSTEQLSVVRTQLEKAKQQSEANIVSLQEAFNAEKRAMQKAFDAEKTKLQDGFKAQKAELQHKTQEKTKDLEQRLGKTTKEIREANTTKARAEKQCATMKDTENALREQITQVSQERDEIKTKLQELNDQAAASNQADAKQTDAKQTDEKQANSISALESKNTDDSAKSADLLQTVTSENKGLKGNVPLLQGAADIVGKVLEYGKTNAVEPKARLTPLESHNWKLSQDLQKARNDLTRSESTRSRLEEDNNRATARLAGLETEAGERQEQIQQLTQDLQAQKASHEAALSELERFKKLVAKESSDAEKPAGNPNPELPGLEKRIESTTTEKNDRNIANPELFKERVRQRPANNNGRLRAEADRLKGRVDAAEKQSSVLKADLLTTRNKLERCQATLKDERARYAKLLYSLKLLVLRPRDFRTPTIAPKLSSKKLNRS
ncbi:hypothetical protein F4861DRAFT_452382 [Xylaria intraflava]|nr:hypothetical protein F4861DRAFT_452382 [Xylaria intraflava]